MLLYTSIKVVFLTATPIIEEKDSSDPNERLLDLIKGEGRSHLSNEGSKLTHINLKRNCTKRIHTGN